MGVQVLAGIGLLLGGLYGFTHALNRSSAFSPGAGVQVVLLCAIVIITGCYLISSAVYP